VKSRAIARLFRVYGVFDGLWVVSRRALDKNRENNPMHSRPPASWFETHRFATLLTMRA
jgi:hypothetical protein